MAVASFHGYEPEEKNKAKVQLGKRKFKEFKFAETVIWNGGVVPPLAAENDRNWSDEIR